MVAAAIVWAGWRIGVDVRASRGGGANDDRLAALLALFAPALVSAQQDPRAFLVWQPIARTARRLFPSEFARLDDAAGTTFPFFSAQIGAAAAQRNAALLGGGGGRGPEEKMTT